MNFCEGLRFEAFEAQSPFEGKTLQLLQLLQTLLPATASPRAASGEEEHGEMDMKGYGGEAM